MLLSLFVCRTLSTSDLSLRHLTCSTTHSFEIRRFFIPSVGIWSSQHCGSGQLCAYATALGLLRWSSPASWILRHKRKKGPLYLFYFFTYWAFLVCSLPCEQKQAHVHEHFAFACAVCHVWQGHVQEACAVAIPYVTILAHHSKGLATTIDQKPWISATILKRMQPCKHCLQFTCFKKGKTGQLRRLFSNGNHMWQARQSRDMCHSHYKQTNSYSKSSIC